MRQWKEYITSGQILQNPTNLTTKKKQQIATHKKRLNLWKEITEHEH